MWLPYVVPRNQKVVANSFRKYAANMVTQRLAASRTAVRRMGGGHDDHHHVHPTFDGEVFNKSTIAPMVLATVIGGAGVICFAAYFQNKKHGFLK